MIGIHRKVIDSLNEIAITLENHNEEIDELISNIDKNIHNHSLLLNRLSDNISRKGYDKATASLIEECVDTNKALREHLDKLIDLDKLIEELGYRDTKKPENLDRMLEAMNWYSYR